MFRSLFPILAVFALAAPALAQSRLPAEGFADLNERLSPAVVNIATAQRVEGVDELPRFPPGSPMERFNEGLGAAQVTSLGSGFIISPDGVVVTNNHVIEAADAIEVILQSGQRFDAIVVGRDPATDIAVLRVQARQTLPHVEMGDSNAARVGDIVLAIGNPFGLGGSLSVGVVSARNRNIDAGRYDDFIRDRGRVSPKPETSGDFVLTTGEVVGRHEGIEGFTVGQRKGLGVALGEPKFVVRIEPDTRRVVLGDREELGRRDLTASECNWLVDAGDLPERCEAQIRYNAPPAPASLTLGSDDRLRLRFDEPQFAVAPGQAAVCYAGDQVLGGGWIE